MIRFSDLNPVRFYQDRNWDFNQSFPTEENLPSTISDKNVGTVEYIQPWATNNKIEIQILQEKDDNVTVYHVISGVKTPILPTDITPTGWAGFGNFVMLYTFTPSTQGALNFLVTEEVTTGSIEYHKSDCVGVEKSLPDCKRIVYYHRNNTYNTVFTKDSTRVFFPIIFLKATTNETLSGGENSISISPYGSISNVRDSPTKGSVLDIALVPAALVAKTRMIMACSDISVNGQFVQKKENPEPLHITGSNAFRIKVNLWKTDYNYTGDYLPVFDIVPPTCGGDDLVWWFKRVGTSYVDQFTGYTIYEQNGRIDFVYDDQALLNPAFAALVEIFNRNNTTIQNSNTKAGYNSFFPYSYTLEEVSEFMMHDWYNEFHKGKIGIKPNRNEILVYATDKILTCDKAIKEYLGYTSYWLLDGSGDVLLEKEKYNVIKST